MKYRSYALTVRPRGGLSDATLSALNSWLSKQDYGVAVTEMENESRHWHGQCWLAEPRARGEICKSLQRICERTIAEWDQAQLKVLRTGVKIAYSDWIDDYCLDNLQKWPPSECLDDLENKTYAEQEEADWLRGKFGTKPCFSRPVPSARTEEYYPSEEEQAAVQAASTAVDKEMHSLLIRFQQECGESRPCLPTQREVATFLYQKAFHEKCISIKRNQRDRVEQTRILHAYICGSDFTDIQLYLPKASRALDSLEKVITEARLHAVSQNEPTPRSSASIPASL